MEKKLTLGADFLRTEITPRYIQKKYKLCRLEAERRVQILNLMSSDKKAKK